MPVRVLRTCQPRVCARAHALHAGDAPVRGGRPHAWRPCLRVPPQHRVPHALARTAPLQHSPYYHPLLRLRRIVLCRLDRMDLVWQCMPGSVRASPSFRPWKDGMRMASAPRSRARLLLASRVALLLRQAVMLHVVSQMEWREQPMKLKVGCLIPRVVVLSSGLWCCCPVLAAGYWLLLPAPCSCSCSSLPAGDVVVGGAGRSTG